MERDLQSIYVWEFKLNENEFSAVLNGEMTIHGLERNGAAIRLLEYGTYPEIIRTIGFKKFLQGWPEWRASIHSISRRRGFDFLAGWLPVHHPELLK